MVNKCLFSGCKCPPVAHVRQNWGKYDRFGFCKNHLPDWIKQGNKQSPIVSIGGVKKSFYALLEN